MSLQSICHILSISEGYSPAEVNFSCALSRCLHKHIHSVVRGLNTASPGFVQLKQANLLPHNSAHNLHGNSEYHLHTSRLKRKHSKEASVTGVKPDKHPNQATTSHFLTLFFTLTVSHQLPKLCSHMGMEGNNLHHLQQTQSLASRRGGGDKGKFHSLI